MRVAIIGSNWGRMHVGACRAAGMEVVALCGRDARKTQEVAGQEGIPRATTEVASALGHVEAVVVASPDGLHREHVALALEAGKHVLCEKPLAMSAGEAEELVALGAGRPRCVSAVGFPFRMLPELAAVKAAARDIRFMSVDVRNSFLDGDQSGSGDLGGASHPLDAILWLMDAPVETVSARTEPLTLSLGFAGGARVELVHRWSPVPGIHHRWAITGPDWEIELAGGYTPERGGWCFEPPRLHDPEEGWRELSIQRHPSQLEPWAEAHAANARAWLAAMRGGDRGALATLGDGLAVQRVLERARVRS